MVSNSKSPKQQDPWERLEPIFRLIQGVFIEISHGVWYGTIPFGSLLLASAILYFSVFFHVDYWFAKHFGLLFLYPTKQLLFETYYLFLIFCPFLMWGLKETFSRRQVLLKLKDAFINSNLQNRLGNTPGLIADYPKDEVMRLLRIRNVGLPVSQYQKAKEFLESSLSIFIDEFQEHREKGTIDIVYSGHPMPSLFDYPYHQTIKGVEFLIGSTRAKDIKATLDDFPHLLVAGQTGGGKSTFLRQLITSLYLNDPNMQFILVDLKGGMEFQLFENLNRTFVPPTASTAINFLNQLSLVVEERMRDFKATKAKDVASYELIKKTSVSRYLVVIDEAAEMFLPGVHSSQDDINSARRILSQIARQGRSLGIHLVIATQRPDVKALDPQIKANLTGVLCFQMMNDASSISVLGTGRATDLPSIPGRAIWKAGVEMTEVQTPFLSVQRAEKLLEKHAKTSKAKKNISLDLKSTQSPEINPEESLIEA